jgi:hypothetical protein
VNGPLAPENATEFRPRKKIDDRHVAGDRTQFPESILPGIAGDENNPDMPTREGGPYLLESAHGLASAPRQPEKTQAPPKQQLLDPVGKPFGHPDRRPRGLRKNSPAARVFHYIARSAQPQSTTGKPSVEVGHDTVVRPDNETNQLVRRIGFATDEATPARRGVGYAPGWRVPVLSGAG